MQCIQNGRSLCNMTKAVAGDGNNEVRSGAHKHDQKRVAGLCYIGVQNGDLTGRPFAIENQPLVGILIPLVAGHGNGYTALDYQPDFVNLQAQKFRKKGVKMKYVNGHLHNEHDVTICISMYQTRKKMSMEEFLPMLVLCLIMAVLLMSGLFA